MKHPQLRRRDMRYCPNTLMNATYGAGNCCLSTVLMSVDGGENIYGCQWNANQAYPIKLERVDLL